MNFKERFLSILTAKLKIKYILLVLLILIFSFTLLSYTDWLRLIKNIPGSETFYTESFNKSDTKWDMVDGEFISENTQDITNNFLKLSSKKYLAPHAMHTLTSDEIPSNNFVLHFKVFVSNFTDSAVTLASLNFSTQPIVIVIDQNGRIGISHQIFAMPEYSTNTQFNLKKNQWQDIYVNIDNGKQVLEVYLNNIKILNKPYTDLTYPLQEIWLGSIWVKGGGSYGVPIDIRYDDITIGNTGILPIPSFKDYLLNRALSLVN